MTRKIAIGTLFTLFAALALASNAPATAPQALSVSPQVVPVGVFYGGADVTVEAMIPGGCQAAVLVTGDSADLTLKKKGKRGGILWMNVGTVSFKSVPVVYKLHGSQNPETLAPKSVLAAMNLGYDAVAEKAIGSEKSPERTRLFWELVKLKEREKLFSMKAEGVSLSPDVDGRTRVSARFRLPAGTPIGAYRISLFAFRDGRGQLVSSGSIEVKRVGLVNLTVSLAHRHGTFYGILSVLIALGAGLFTGFLFGMKGKGGH